MDSELLEKKQILLDNLAQKNTIAVAFSGGVDSAVLAKAAVEARHEFCIALCAISDSMPEGEPERIFTLAQEIGIACRFVPTDEIGLPDYQANLANRCYTCKKHIFSQLAEVAQNNGFGILAEGSNIDDTFDFRPGAKAVQELGVLSPLADAGLTKDEVRELARDWRLSVAERPSTPCLSSRIAYGLKITPERLRRIDKAEAFLSRLGVTPLRVRTLASDVAIIETSEKWISQLTLPKYRDEITKTLLNLGFSWVCISMAPFQSGKMNMLLLKSKNSQLFE